MLKTSFSLSLVVLYVLLAEYGQHPELLLRLIICSNVPGSLSPCPMNRFTFFVFYSIAKKWLDVCAVTQQIKTQGISA